MRTVEYLLSTCARAWDPNVPEYNTSNIRDYFIGSPNWDEFDLDDDYEPGPGDILIFGHRDSDYSIYGHTAIGHERRRQLNASLDRTTPIEEGYSRRWWQDRNGRVFRPSAIEELHVPD